MYKEKDILSIEHQDDIPGDSVIDLFIVLSLNGKNGEDHVRCALFEPAIEYSIDLLDDGIIQKPDVYVFEKEELEDAAIFGTINDDIFDALKIILDL